MTKGRFLVRSGIFKVQLLLRNHQGDTLTNLAVEVDVAYIIQYARSTVREGAAQREPQSLYSKVTGRHRAVFVARSHEQCPHCDDK